MSEKLLHGAEIDTGHDEVARERVPKIVPPKIGDAGRVTGAAEGGVEGRVGDAITPWPGEDPFAVARQRVDDRADIAVQRDVALLVVLGELDREEPDREVEIAPAEIQEFALPKSGVDGENDRGLEPARHVGARSRKKPLDVIGGEVAQAGVVLGKVADVAPGASIEELPRDALRQHGFEERQLAVDRARSNLPAALGLPALDAPGGKIGNRS